VAVIGAGPAGLFASKALAARDVEVALINRDIKPGGLAEYGVYYDRYAFKNGLRVKFRQVLDSPTIHYYGNLIICEDGVLCLDDLHAMGFHAVLVTVGAQGTKWLGLPGENLRGVYHAKELVYHYNKLPPFSERVYPIGDRTVLIGVGNVMMDIATWLVRHHKVQEVVAITRRGPAEVKVMKNEWVNVAKNLDLEDFEGEITRVTPVMETNGQDVAKAKDYILSPIKKALDPISDTRFRFQFLASPSRIIADNNGTVVGLEVEDTTLQPRDGGGTQAIPLGSKRILETDMVVFCIGDRVEENFGLPLDQWDEFAKNPEPLFPVKGISYEAYNPAGSCWIEGVFLAGWAREASSGMVGRARRDGINGANAVLRYLETLPPPNQRVDAISALENRLSELEESVVKKSDWRSLELVEQEKAQKLGLVEYKFSSKQDMLQAIESARVSK
jgi:ferredoxin--NADP+ reductase